MGRDLRVEAATGCAGLLNEGPAPPPDSFLLRLGWKVAVDDVGVHGTLAIAVVACFLACRGADKLCSVLESRVVLCLRLLDQWLNLVALMERVAALRLVREECTGKHVVLVGLAVQWITDLL